jgi:hypothetical protein
MTSTMRLGGRVSFGSQKDRAHWQRTRQSFN